MQPRAQFLVFEVSSQSYLQFAHLINIREVHSIQVIISQNLFTNISLTGPIINIEGLANTSSQLILVTDNRFHLVHSYVGEAVMRVRRSFATLSEASTSAWINSDPLLRYLSFGGGVAIEANNFSEIVGCPTTDTGLIELQAIDMRPELVGARAQSASLKLLDLYEPIQSLLNETNYNQILSLLSANEPRAKVSATTDGTEYTFNLLSTSFKGNHYTNLSMGVSSKLEDSLIRGSLIKLNNFLAVDFKDERFENVGAFTQEHLTQVTA